MVLRPRCHNCWWLLLTTFPHSCVYLLDNGKAVGDYVDTACTTCGKIGKQPPFVPLHTTRLSSHRISASRARDDSEQSGIIMYEAHDCLRFLRHWLIVLTLKVHVFVRGCMGRCLSWRWKVSFVGLCWSTLESRKFDPHSGNSNVMPFFFSVHLYRRGCFDGSETVRSLLPISGMVILSLWKNNRKDIIYFIFYTRTHTHARTHTKTFLTTHLLAAVWSIKNACINLVPLCSCRLSF